MMLRVLIFLYFILVTSSAFSKEIPVIVISASKKPQSLSSVGTSVTVLDENFFNNSSEYFLGDALSTSTTGANFFQSGGHGTSSAIQLRGMPKRYSTVYIDGIKMSDPSSVSNDFDFANILTSQVSRVEILKGNQSSVYGSGAIGGTIHVFTKKREPGFKKDINFTTGSHGTNNLATSVSGGDENMNYYVGLQRFQTDGISQMTHNDEKDRYRNNGLVASFGNKFSDTLELESNVRVSETYLQYDQAQIEGSFGCSTCDHSEEVDGVESSTNVSLIYKPIEKLTNKFTVANTYIKRVYGETPNSNNTKQDKYYGERYAFLYQGNYNFDLDSSVVFGLEREDDQMGRDLNAAGTVNSNAYVTSQYFDYQRRITNNIYGTFGARFDEHSLAGGTGSNEDSHRATLAYVFDDKTTKLKSSYGTGYRFPSLFEMKYAYRAGSNTLPFVKAETSQSYDFGIEKSISPNLFIDLTYFNVKYFDALEGWKSNTAGGTSSTQNTIATVKSQGIELMSKYKLNEFFNFGLNYTYTSSYDGADEDNLSGPDSGSQMVRVPRNLVNLITNIKVPAYKDLDITLRTKWSDKARDYGNGNATSDKSPAFQNETLDSYLVNDLSLRYNFFNSYNLYFDITNVFDKKYETALQYSQMDRSFNFGIKKSY
jgi:vitamin B12 transporter